MNHHHGHEHANGHHQVNGEQPTEEELDAYQTQLTHEAIQDQVKAPPPFPMHHQLSQLFLTGQTFFIAQEKRVLLYHDYEEYVILIPLLGVY